MQKQTTVGVFYGGTSPEHDISKISAAGILNNIDRTKFNVIEIFIEKNGEIATDISSLKTTIDIAMPILHGEGGEDGSIQGFFKTLKIPFVGSDIISSAICLDKGIFNELMHYNGLPQAKFEILDSYSANDSLINEKINKINKTFNFPLFVKPARTGSSVGVVKVKNSEDLKSAIKTAKQFDNKIIVEESIENCTEIEVAVLGNSIDNIEVSLPGKIIPGAEFYDYEDKYLNNKTIFEIPANLPNHQINKIQQLAKQAYLVANCIGLARVDFLVNETGIYLNEINTMPGFTPTSMYPKLWEESGLTYKDLITKLISIALTK